MTLRIELAEARKQNKELRGYNEDVAQERDILKTSLETAGSLIEVHEEQLKDAIKRVAKMREYNEELNDKNRALEATLAALGTFKDETDKELDKANLLLKMSRNQVKQMERDTHTTRSVYNDVIEDMMTRQVMMAAAGWDEYVARKKRREEADDS